jgi:hypothetical protein
MPVASNFLPSAGLTALASAMLGLHFAAPTHAAIVINEIHYDPNVKTERVEFIELHNPTPAPIELGGWSLRNAVTFVFPNPTTIPAHGYLVTGENPAALLAKFGVTALGPWTGVLANEGEVIELRDAEGRLMDRVDYGRGFPWPTVGDPPGYSIELIHPSLANDLGGHWRSSVAGDPSQQTVELVASRSAWRYLKGTNPPSDPVTAWRDPAFNDSDWPIGQGPVGYDPAIAFGTTLDDMRYNYTSFFLRGTFNVTDPALFSSLTLFALYDDGFRVWINGVQVLSINLPSGELAHTDTASSAIESNDYLQFNLNNPATFLQTGPNTIAVQVHNSSRDSSSDCFFDARLLATTGPASRGPTPGARNSVFADNAPPAIRQVNHSPASPTPGQAVTITARVTDPDGVASVALHYQLVDPGNYLELTDPAYSDNWATLPMRDDGTAGDLLANDSVYTIVLAPDLHTHRRLVRYRITATDQTLLPVRVPYPDDPVPNFAYFVYGGVPAWTGATRPGAAGTLGQTFTVSSTEMNRLPVVHLLAKRTTVEQATWFSRYGGDAYLWLGTLVYNGKVYDHVRYRARGGVWRYSMVKNMWKFDFNRGHDLELHDNWGRPYRAPWRKLNLGASIQQGDYNHRGEQGMFESVGFRLFELAGVEAPKSTFLQFRIIDDAAETLPDNQYDGDFWGVYLAVEQEDGRFLDEHGLPDANFYKMEGGTGELNNLGPFGPDNKSDLNAFLNVVNSSQGPTVPDSWWRTNLNLHNYYSYQTIVQAIHHYDICYDKNFFYYRHPADNRWQVMPWDLDLTWAENMFDANCGGADRIKNGLLPNTTLRPEIHLEWRNRIREIRDLLFNDDEAWRLIDEYAGRLRGPTHAPSIIDADRAQWDYNPRMNSSTYTPHLSKAGQGRFYQWPNEPWATKDFNGCIQIMKQYVSFRSTSTSANPSSLDRIAADPFVPTTPVITYIGPDAYPANQLQFHCSDYTGTAPFASMQWRIAEITAPTEPSWQSRNPWRYEIETTWTSGELPHFDPELTVPPGLLKPGLTYRVRARFTDQTGRTSHWSAPAQFVVAPPDNAATLVAHLRVTELMVQPLPDSDFEFIEILNLSPTQTLDLAGAKFTAGVDYTFPTGATLAPGEYALVIPHPNPDTFRAHYQLPTTLQLFGPYAGRLDNSGETLELKTAPGGERIADFTFNNGRGWPQPAFGSDHSLVPLPRSYNNQATGALDYSGNWRASTYQGGSPGEPDPAPPPPALLINEIAAHTDYNDPAHPDHDSNDWIELVNVSPDPISLAHYYLSDNPAQLTKWALPAHASLEPDQRVVYDEITGFHNPITSGFGIDKAGEQILLSYLPGTPANRVVDSVRFKGQENEVALGRYPDAFGPFRYPLPRTPNAANLPPQPAPVFSEIMYHPIDPDPTTDNTWDEFIEIHNPTSASLALHSDLGSWRIDGGISFTFPAGLTLAAGGTLLVVSFDPADPAALATFLTAYTLPNPSPQILGPYSSKLGNRSNRLALERPQAPDNPGDPYSWVILDEVTYGNQNPWPTSANGNGHSLHRRYPPGHGNDPDQWHAAPPTPGSSNPTNPWVDTDGDGIPDDWELQYDLDPHDPNDAHLDADNDGLSNFDEYHAGTHPRDPTSTLRFHAVTTHATGVTLELQVIAGRTYTLEYTTSLEYNSWHRLLDLPSQPLSRIVSILDSNTPSLTRHYRAVTPSRPQ